MTRIPVKSSDIESVGYEGSTLEIQFHGGGIYQYFNVPEFIYIGLMCASSYDKYFRAYIKDKYISRKIRLVT